MLVSLSSESVCDIIHCKTLKLFDLRQFFISFQQWQRKIESKATGEEKKCEEKKNDGKYSLLHTNFYITTTTIMFGLGGTTPQISSQQKLQAAEAELDMVTGMFNALVSQCHTKCINKSYNEADISKQESLCLDRCVAKYFETNVKVGENMQKLGQSGQFMGRR